MGPSAYSSASHWINLQYYVWTCPNYGGAYCQTKEVVSTFLAHHSRLQLHIPVDHIPSSLSFFWYFWSPWGSRGSEIHKYTTFIDLKEFIPYTLMRNPYPYILLYHQAIQTTEGRCLAINWCSQILVTQMLIYQNTTRPRGTDSTDSLAWQKIRLLPARYIQYTTYWFVCGFTCNWFSNM